MPGRWVVRECAHQPLGQHPRRLDELRIVEQDERLQRGDGHVAPCDADLARHGVERRHRRRRRGAAPERVETAAIQLVAGVLRVGLAGARLLPQPLRLVRLDARAADVAHEQATRGQRAVADVLGWQAHDRTPCQQRVVGVAAQQVWRACDVWRKVVRRHDEAVQRLDVPAALDEPRRQPIEQLGMRRLVVPGCRSPPAVATRPRPKCIFQIRLTTTRAASGLSGLGEPARQSEPVAGLVGWKRRQTRRGVARHHLSGAS